jgi:hypothetical protein
MMHPQQRSEFRQKIRWGATLSCDLERGSAPAVLAGEVGFGCQEHLEDGDVAPSGSDVSCGPTVDGVQEVDLRLQCDGVGVNSAITALHGDKCRPQLR